MIEFTDEMRTRIGTALTDGLPLVAATVDEDGQPKIAFFGSTHVHSDDQLAFWARDPEGGTVRRLRAHPRISFLYRNPTERVRWVFEGRARVVDDLVERDRVYDEMPELEQLFDRDRKGVAIVVDIDRITGRDLDVRR